MSTTSRCSLERCNVQPNKPLLQSPHTLKEGRRSLVSRWYLAGAICTAFAFCLVLLQYGVSEAVYGIGGMNGPYVSGVTSNRPQWTGFAGRSTSLR